MKSMGEEFMRRILVRTVLFGVFLATVILAGVRYYCFVTDMVFRESAGHLIEIYSQANQSLENLMGRNWRYLRMWASYLRDVSDDDMAEAFVREMQEEIGFTDFFFLSREGRYRTVDGEQGYLILQESLPRLFLDGEEIVTNSVRTGESEIMVFAVPCDAGTYLGLNYEAIGISFNNRDIVDTLEISAFDGASKSFVIYPDGRVLIDNNNEQSRSVYNFFGMLSDRSDLDAREIEALEQEIRAERTGVRTVQIEHSGEYLVYQNVGFGSWSLVGLVPTDVVNANMNRLQRITILVVIAITASLSIGLLAVLVHSNRKSLQAKDVEIRYREELFSTLSNNVDDIFLMLDGKGTHVDYVSPNIEKLTGITAQEALSNVETLRSLENDEDGGNIRRRIMGILPGQQGEWEREFLHQKTGEVRWFRVTVLCRDIQNEKKYIIVLSDRSKEKMTNHELKEAVDTANRASRAKSIFLSSVSHDIRTPMNAIIGFATLAIAKIGDDERIREYLTRILSSADHLLNLINDVLDMSCIESGKMHLYETEVSLSEVLREVKTIIGGQICAKRLELFMEISGEVRENVVCDKMRMKQLLLNLLSNSIKFTPECGVISVRIAKLRDQLNGKGLYELRVKDTGKGMKAEFVERVFDPFEREYTSTVSGIQGSGLGLAISKNIVSMMGGDISVATELGTGTEFIIHIPLKQGPKADPPQQIPELEGERALVVNSREAECRGIVRMLTQLGMRADCAESGQEAVWRIRQAVEGEDLYRVCVVDRRLTDGEGLKAVGQMEDTVGSNRPIFIMTAYDWSDIETQARNAGIAGFCMKPVFLTDIQDVLLEVLNGRKAEKESYLPMEEFAKFKGKKILLAEDNELSREIETEILESYGFIIDTAADGGEAVRKVARGGADCYDLILMDLQMPVMDGYEATRCIRALVDPEAARIPIFAVTANAFVEDRELARRNGMDGFISKPIDIRDFIRKLEHFFA